MKSADKIKSKILDPESLSEILRKEKQSGKYVSGISLQGSSVEKLQFIKKLVRSYREPGGGRLDGI